MWLTALDACGVWRRLCICAVACFGKVRTLSADLPGAGGNGGGDPGAHAHA
jgi:hypothetical protein